MRYKVDGQNRDTGARMTLEFEADSKAAAERKASGAGMHVHHVDAVGTAPDGTDPGVAERYRGPVRTGGGGLVKLVLLVIVIAAVAWFFQGQIRGWLGR